jgi:hypothetical protein
MNQEVRAWGGCGWPRMGAGTTIPQMRVAVFSTETVDGVKAQLPSRFRDAPLPTRVSAGPLMVLIVENGDHVVTSTTLRRALRKAGVVLEQLARARLAPPGAPALLALLGVHRVSSL